MSNSVSLEAEIGEIHKCNAKCELFYSQPKPVFIVEWKGRWLDDDFSTALMFLAFGIGRLHSGRKTSSIVRCTEIERLPHILKNGCDVFPTNSVFWVDKFPSKALEYGGDEKVMMVFDFDFTEASYVEVDSNIDQQRLQEIKELYPTVVRSIDGSKFWLSRLMENDKRVASPYEVEHGRWIPGNPFEALSGFILLGRNLNDTMNFAKAVIGRCDHPKWM